MPRTLADPIEFGGDVLAGPVSLVGAIVLGG